MSCSPYVFLIDEAYLDEFALIEMVQISFWRAAETFLCVLLHLPNLHVKVLTLECRDHQPELTFMATPGQQVAGLNPEWEAA